MCEFPSLPCVEPKVHFLTDFSESEKTAEESSLVESPSIYGSIPVGFESEVDTNGESDLHSQSVGRDKPSTSAIKRTDDNLPELSGRSRAILKTYFNEAKPFNLPHGHPTVAFTESLMYHLLRVLSDETLKMSKTTIEQIVVDAVMRKPTTAPSRTAHFQTRSRAQTPGRWWKKHNSSSSESDQGGSLLEKPGLKF